MLHIVFDKKMLPEILDCALTPFLCVRENIVRKTTHHFHLVKKLSLLL